MSSRAYLLAPRIIAAFTGDAHEVEQQVRELAGRLEEGETETLLGLQLDAEAVSLLPLPAIRWLLVLRSRHDLPLLPDEVDAVFGHSRDEGAIALLARDLVRHHPSQVEQYRGKGRVWIERARAEYFSLERPRPQPPLDDDIPF
jgi:hypothetical protein